MSGNGNNLPRVAIQFDNLGPYHRARLGRASHDVRLTAIQSVACSNEYAWRRSERASEFPLITLADKHDSNNADSSDARKLHRVLDECSPQVIAVPGWSSRMAVLAVRWALNRRVPIVAMSASTHGDSERSTLKEAIKRRYLALCSAGLVGGKPHRVYFQKLRMPADQIFLGYDAVDNDFFAQNAASARAGAKWLRASHGLPERFFIASNRFIAKKNLTALVTAFADYRERVGGDAWDLVIIGDGELRSNLEEQRDALGLGAVLHFPGFKQYDDLPIYFGLAQAFIHASTVEQWGLVVNEAMASGLPVLVSERCGCASDLVTDGVNGWTFNPFSIAAITDAMVRMTQLDFERRREMGDASQHAISKWGPDRFAAGLKAAAAKALEVGPKRAGLLDRAVLELMIRTAR